MVVVVRQLDSDRPGLDLTRAVVVIVDALRASTTVAVALALGAIRVLPVAEIEEALRLKSRQGYLIAGERRGVWLEGFDFGNSPCQLVENKGRLAGCTLVLTTSNGTQAVAGAAGSRGLLMGSLPNLDSVSRSCLALAREKEAGITIIPAGWFGSPAVEDLYTAGRIGLRLRELGAEFDQPAEMEKLCRLEPGRVFRDSPSGRRLIGLGQEKDVDFCARLDTLKVAPVFDGQSFVAGGHFGPEMALDLSEGRD